MAPKKKLQVFVSSTFTDLKVERQAAVEAILKGGHIPAGMELFTAGDQSQWELITQWIDDCDVYLLILGGRYGSIDPNTGKSYTQLEYEYAVEKGKPYFALVVTEEHQEKRVRKQGTKVTEKEEPKKLKEFREMVSSKIVEFWSDPRDIKSSVATKLAEYSHRSDLKGWIPGDTATRASKEEKVNKVEEIIAGLTNEAKDILQRAAGGDGEIMVYHTKDGYHIIAGDREYVGDDDPRNRAIWEGAIEELEAKGLLKSSGNKREIFRITNQGYKIADKLKIQEYSSYKLISAPHSGREIVLQFRNPSQVPINVIYIDSSGAEKKYKELNIDDFGQITSFINHAWLIRNSENDLPILEFKINEHYEGAPGTMP